MTNARMSPEPRGGDPIGWYRVFYAACIAALSVVTVLQARGVHDHHAWLGSVELAGAVLLIPRRARTFGLAVLLAVHAIAIVLTVHAGRIPIHLVLYAGTAIFVAADGGARTRVRT